MWKAWRSSTATQRTALAPSSQDSTGGRCDTCRRYDPSLTDQPVDTKMQNGAMVEAEVPLYVEVTIKAGD